MRFLKEELIKIGGLALSGIAFTSCGGAFLPSGAAATKIVEALAPNFAHQLLSGIDYNRFKEFLLKPHPDNLNHDLERLMKDAMLQAFHHIETAYLDKLEKGKQYSKWEKIINRPFADIKTAFKQLRKNLLREEDYQKEFGEEITEADRIIFSLPNTLSVASNTDLPKLINEIFKFPEIENEDEWLTIRKYFEDNLPRIYDLSFKEALKDERNTRSYKAYQIFALEIIVDQNEKTHKGLDEIKTIVLALEHNLRTATIIKCDEMLKSNIHYISEELNTGFESVISQILSTEKNIINKIESSADKIIAKLVIPKPDKILAEPPFCPPVFLGREEEIEDIRSFFFSGSEFLLLLSGKGGIGKTSIASKYYLQNKHLYNHVAWVLCETDIGEALLSLSDALHIQFEPQHSKHDRLEILIKKLAGLDSPSLLVIDNANDIKDLATYYKALLRCSNFHILLTTRITRYAENKIKVIDGMPIEKALELFQTYSPTLKASEKGLFEKLYKAVDGNTLVLELLGKQLAIVEELGKEYCLEDLILDLQSKGLLGLKHNKKVDIHYQKLNEASPEQVLLALYDLQGLSLEERKLMSVFSALPSESIYVEKLDILLKDYTNWEDTLFNLSKKGWLNRNKAERTVKISPVIQEVIKKKNLEIESDTFPLLKALSYELAYEFYSHQEHGR